MNSEIPKSKCARAVFLLWGAYFAALFARILWIDERGLMAGHEFVWGDWPLHIAQAMVFAEKDFSTWFAYHPVFADGKMTYPFLSNMLSGLLMRAQVPLVPAMVGQSIFLCFLLLFGLFFLFRHLARSEGKAALGVSLFFLSAGWGFVSYLRAPGLMPSEMYSIIGEIEWLSGNVVVGLLLPQRAFLMGITLAVWALLFLMAGLEKKSRRYFVAGGILTGLLPIAHAHSLIAMAFLVGAIFFFHVRRWKELLWFALPASFLGFTLIKIFILGGMSRPGFMAWHLGYSTQSFPGWILFWLNVWGLMIPAAFGGAYLVYREEKKSFWALGLGALALFAVSNLVRFQPLLWDNSKLYLWVYLVFSLFAAEAVFWVFRQSRLLAAVLVALLTFTGLLELIFVQRISAHTHQMMSAEEIRLMEKIRRGTGPLDRFLTAPIHNHPVMVMGARPILMGYAGWVYNYGIDYQETESDMAKIFSGAEGAAELLQKHRIHYVYLGPSERATMKANENFFLHEYPVAFESETIKVFDVSRLRP